MTTLQELIREIELIEAKSNTLEEKALFDRVLGIIKSKYIEKEKEQIIVSFLKGKFEGGGRFEYASVEYYKELCEESQ
jgi:hypothetical protein